MIVPFISACTVFPPARFTALVATKVEAAPVGQVMQLAVTVLQAVEEMQDSVITSQM